MSSVPPAGLSQPPLRNSYWVIPGLLLAGEHPGGSTKDKTKDRLKKLLGAGIECFVDLTKATELLRYDVHLPFYVEYVRKPIKDHGLPANPALMVEILDHIGNAMRAGRPVYVHCRAGIGRTGTVVGCLLVERGLSGDGALDELNRLWQQCKRSKTWSYIPETDEQGNYVRAWKARGASGSFNMTSTAAAIAAVGPMSAATEALSSEAAAAAVDGRGSPRRVAGATSATAGGAAGAVRGGAAGYPRDGGGQGREAAGYPRDGGGQGREGAGYPRDGGGQGREGAGYPHDGSGQGRAAAGPRDGSSTTGAGASAQRAVDAFVQDRERSEVDEFAAVRHSLGNGKNGNGGAAAEARAYAGNTAAGAGDAGADGMSGIARAAARADGATRADGAPRPDGAARADGTARADRDAGYSNPAPQSNGSSTQPRAALQEPALTPAELDPLLDPATLAAARGLRDRFIGALYGLAVGDAVAAATQYRRPGSFSPIGDMLGGGPFDLPRGGWSDDTAMALCLSESLLECNGFDARDQVQRYVRWQQEGYLSSTGQCVGITANTARALAMAGWRRVLFAGSHDPEQLDPEPLSRIAPVVLYFFASLEAVLQQASDSARTTCQAPLVLDCCRRLARAIHAGLGGAPKSVMLNEIQPTTESATHANTTAVTALASAYWAFSTTDNYRDAILRAANVGGNSDVVAAVTGQLAGSHYGVSAIPASWRNGLVQKDLIEQFADRLLAHGLVSLGG